MSAIAAQARRIALRGWALASARTDPAPGWHVDAHDNNWLLLEAGLAVPFAIGYRTAAVARLLALMLLLEAVACWPAWVSYPTWCAPGVRRKGRVGRQLVRL